MSTLSVWTFDTAYGAESAAETLWKLPVNERDGVHDAARVSWVRGSSKPTTRRVGALASDEALGDDFFGLLFALIFFSPLVGAAVGSAKGALMGSLADFGIDDITVNRVRDAVTPGTSALFVLGADNAVDQVRDAMRAYPLVSAIVTTLTRRQVGALRQVFVG
jgi:uncharacterized membrane protein